jgi:hypothetical protein
MKTIQSGIRYDTEKAILIGEADSGGSVTDFSHWSAGLYKTPRAGRYFLAGEGGPMTRWSRSAGQNSWTGSEGIIPLSREEALEWAERYLPTKAVEEHFADMIEDT